MKYNEVLEVVLQLCADESLSFVQKGAVLEQELKKCTTEEIIEHLLYAGVIPEKIGHDSTEEKVFAKYCDALLSRSLSEIGIPSKTLEARGDAADVIGKTDKYSIVGDAKAFRLSRTAKNQKDFKVEALNQWRQGADYACLLGPIYQYPNSSSQIYKQAITYNVTLLSYTHMAFLIVNRQRITDLTPLWEVGKKLQPSKDANTYWNAILAVILSITGKTKDDWNKLEALTMQCLSEQVGKQIAYWVEQKEVIASYDREKAIEELIKALKIDNKINIIKKYR
ncbi:hypothetical protein HNQ85_001303 [Anoxybacillus calidus]|jgi:hypothetical protein|uniref:Restriction endonuclease n=1 Tax=[Anoxybacillus] calidus TaxID=575178 RepID=A0A7V9YZ91_9BACL|nr:HindIII family type II restriction endonuclease [Anoxybacillus calidus]MBA2871033.1 hypothetical protein [Anoxybacillus calidus]